MNSAAHQITGLILGLILVWLPLTVEPDAGYAAWALLIVTASVIGQILPDVIDPARGGNWLHRSLAHSLFVALPVYVVMGAVGLFVAATTHLWGFMVLGAFGLSAAMHLIMDATTPVGLPGFVGNSLFGMALPVNTATVWLPIVNVVIFVVSFILLVRKLGPVLALDSPNKAILRVSSPFLLVFGMLGAAFIIFGMQAHWLIAWSLLYPAGGAILLVGLPLAVLLGATVALSVRQTYLASLVVGRTTRQAAGAARARLDEGFARIGDKPG